MKNAIIGYNGTIGNYLLRSFDFTDFYNTSNILDLQHKSYNTILISAPSGNRLNANKSPDSDKQSIDNLDRKSTRLNSSHIPLSRMPSSA